MKRWAKIYLSSYNGWIKKYNKVLFLYAKNFIAESNFRV